MGLSRKEFGIVLVYAPVLCYSLVIGKYRLTLENNTMVTLAELRTPRTTQTPEFDKHFDPKTGLNADGYSKEAVVEIMKMAKRPVGKIVSSEELDDILGI